MAHGLLHLLGYKDKEEVQIQAMRAAENRCLDLFHDAKQDAS
jgi:ssRNA-specific RNase YbeY (16S rRNA maturation enzyme)